YKNYRYAYAGERNSVTSVWSFDIQSRRTDKIYEGDEYIPRLYPFGGGDDVCILTLNRAQDCLRIYTVSSSSGVSQLLLEERGDKYISDGIADRIKITPSSILVPSERAGHRALYVYSLNGTLLRDTESDAGAATDIYGMNEATGDVYYQSAPDAMNRTVNVLRKNGKTETLAGDKGWNRALFSSDCAYFVNTWSDMNTPYVVTSRNAKGKIQATLETNAAVVRAMSDTGFGTRETFTFVTSEGVELTGWMLKPKGFSPSERYPVVMYQYSGPGSQQVVNGWQTGSMGQAFDYYLAERGYIVVCVDGRGTGGRGPAFERSVYGQLGVLEARDQVETARWLSGQSYVDGDRIGIWGWSYGGFAALMAMSTGEDVFRCGVAVAPVTDWRLYDTVYTERYMRTPQENPDGYADCPVSRADKLSGALLLCFGMEDDNVHPENTLSYTSALVEADKDYRQVVYTDCNHNINKGNSREHLLRQIADWFDEHLK
ncbi:MAG: alpha/beta fold hydrolase, partial [Prevotella sp.]|nr:alpha/beta fold hydrolase [Prevotella sp.]